MSRNSIHRRLIWACSLAFSACLTAGSSGQSEPPATQVAPATQPTDSDYPALVQDLLKAHSARQAAQGILQKRLKELTGVTTPAAEQERRELLAARRRTDLELTRLTRIFQIKWLALSLPEQMRKEYAALPQDDKMELLATRTAEWRLAVPLPPADLKAAQLSDVIAAIARECDVRIVPDWPALQSAGARADSLVSVDFGKYDQPAINVLNGILSAVTNNKAWVNASHPEAVLLTTEEGEKARGALGKRVVPRIAEVQAWRGFSAPLDPVNLMRVPLMDAVYPAASAGGPMLIDWAGLADQGITPQTLVDLGLPAHRLPHRLLALAEGLEATPAIKQKGGIKFDVIGGSVLVSSPAGFAIIRAGVSSLQTSAGQDAANRKLLDTSIPVIESNGAALGEVLAFVSESSGNAVAADWRSLEACGLTFKTPVTLLTREAVPLGMILPMLVRTPADKPQVKWEFADGKLTLCGPKQ